jgi:hypothetical protein
MASPSKTKGKSGERELCKILEGIFNEPFQRVFSSGAFVGGKNAFRRQTLSETVVRAAKGDIVPPDSMPKLVIECKSYRSFPWHQLVRTGEVKVLEGKEGWIPQTLDAVDPGDIWFLCMKFNNIGWFVLFKPALLNEAAKAKGLQLEYIMPNVIVWKDYLVADLVDFFKTYANELKILCA